MPHVPARAVNADLFLFLLLCGRYVGKGSSLTVAIVSAFRRDSFRQPIAKTTASGNVGNNGLDLDDVSMLSRSPE